MKQMRTMSGLCSALLLVLALLAAGCSRDASGDVRALLATVPADASFVGVADLAELCHDTGVKIEKGTIVLPEEARATLAKENPSMLSMLSTPSGVSITAVAFFKEGYNTYLTGLLDDPDTFRTFVKEQMKETLEKEDDFELGRRVAIKGNQFWMLDGTPQSATLKQFLALSDNQSVLSKDYASLLIDDDEALRFVGDINAMLGAANMKFSESSMVRLGISALFNDPSFLVVKADVEKKEFDVEVSVLSAKCKPASFLLPCDKVDASVVKGLSCTGSLFVAMGLNKKLIDKVQSVVGSMVPQSTFAGLDQLSGTTVVAVDDKPGASGAIKGVVSVKGEPSSDLLKIVNSLAEGANVVREKGRLSVQRGEVVGKVTSDEAASRLKGAYLGCVMADNRADGENVGIVSICAYPDEGGLKIEVKGTSAEGAVLGFAKSAGRFVK